ncbi:MAG: hypothetical protein GF334_00010 [Candidatus Altiarchaeales archaeon]|nr:hypothetical protein [Candidatus Altiarchaeales archaeon]
MNKVLAATIATLILLATTALAQTDYLDEAEGKICEVLQSVYELLLYIAGALGALVITIQGINWVVSADNAKARNTAKTAVVHVLVGLIIISLALVLVAIVLPEGSDCVTTWPGWPTT